MRPQAADPAMLVITYLTIATEIVLGAGRPMGSRNGLGDIFNLVAWRDKSWHCRLAADATAALYMLPMPARATRGCSDIERTKDVILVLVGEIAAEPPGSLSGKTVNRDTAHARRSAP
jgi:hypothetical protein